MDLKNVQKQGRDERMQEDYPTSAVYFLQMYRVVFLSSFISALFCTFLGPSLLEIKFYKKLFFP